MTVPSREQIEALGPNLCLTPPTPRSQHLLSPRQLSLAPMAVAPDELPASVESPALSRLEVPVVLRAAAELSAAVEPSAAVDGAVSLEQSVAWRALLVRRS